MGFRDLGFRDLGFRDLGFRDLGFRDLGLRDLGFRVYSEYEYGFHVIPDTPAVPFFTFTLGSPY